MGCVHYRARLVSLVMESVLSPARSDRKITKKRDGKFRREGVLERLVLGERSSEFETK